MLCYLFAFALVLHLENCWVRKQTHLGLLVDGLNGNCVIFSPHRWRDLKLVESLLVWGFNAQRLVLVIVVCDENPVVRDGGATVLNWFFPVDLDSLWRGLFSNDVLWLRNTDSSDIIRIEHTVLVDTWLVNIK